jgi:hypothetical protein
MRPVLGVGAAVLWLAASGCTSTTSTKTEAGEAAVRRFFQALPSGDCAVLGPLLVAGASCEDALKGLREHDLRLLDIVDATVDGRNPDAVLVRARVSQGGAARQEPYVFRVERQGDGWRLRL